MNNTRHHPFAHHHLISRDEIIFLVMISEILGVSIAKNMNILAIKAHPYPSSKKDCSSNLNFPNQLVDLQSFSASSFCFHGQIVIKISVHTI